MRAALYKFVFIYKFRTLISYSRGISRVRTIELIKLLRMFVLTKRSFDATVMSSRPMADEEVCAAKTFQLSITS